MAALSRPLISVAAPGQQHEAWRADAEMLAYLQPARPCRAALAASPAKHTRVDKGKSCHCAVARSTQTDGQTTQQRAEQN